MCGTKDGGEEVGGGELAGGEKGGFGDSGEVGDVTKYIKKGYHEEGAGGGAL